MSTAASSCIDSSATLGIGSKLLNEGTGPPQHHSDGEHLADPTTRLDPHNAVMPVVLYRSAALLVNLIAACGNPTSMFYMPAFDALSLPSSAMQGCLLETLGTPALFIDSSTSIFFDAQACLMIRSPSCELVMQVLLNTRMRLMLKARV